MGKITELTVTKGRTVRAGPREEWVRVEYSVKAAVDDESELQVAKAQLEGLIDGWLTAAAKPLSAAAPRALFPKELADLLSFEKQGEYTIIRPRQFLGSDNFAKIAGIVKKHGGEYVSAGKQSHFRIPRKAAK